MSTQHHRLFSLQYTADVDFALGSLHCVKENIADVSEVHTTYIFRVEVNKMSECLCILVQQTRVVKGGGSGLS
jgi:hypothetical protein